MHCIICRKETDRCCTACGKLWYCSVECQRRDWPTHKETCNSSVGGAGQFERPMQISLEAISPNVKLLVEPLHKSVVHSYKTKADVKVMARTPTNRWMMGIIRDFDEQGNTILARVEWTGELGWGAAKRSFPQTSDKVLKTTKFIWSSRGVAQPGIYTIGKNNTLGAAYFDALHTAYAVWHDMRNEMLLQVVFRPEPISDLIAKTPETMCYQNSNIIIMSRRRTSSRSRSQVKSNGKPTGSSVVYSRDYDQYSEEYEVYDALTRAVNDHNHDDTDDVRLGPLNTLETDTDWFLVPFVTSNIFSFRLLSGEMGDRLNAEVDISAGVDVTEDGSTHYNFKISRESYRKSHKDTALWQRMWRIAVSHPIPFLLLVVICAWYQFA